MINYIGLNANDEYKKTGATFYYQFKKEALVIK